MVEPAISNGELLVLPERLTDFAGNRVGGCKDRVERTVLADPLRGGLGADARNPRQVVAGFADQSGKVWILLCVNAVLGKHRVVVHSRKIHDALDRVKNRGLGANQLKSVSVARDDQDVETLVGSLVG